VILANRFILLTTQIHDELVALKNVNNTL